MVNCWLFPLQNDQQGSTQIKEAQNRWLDGAGDFVGRCFCSATTLVCWGLWLIIRLVPWSSPRDLQISPHETDIARCDLSTIGENEDLEWIQEASKPKQASNAIMVVNCDRNAWVKMFSRWYQPWCTINSFVTNTSHMITIVDPFHHSTNHFEPMPETGLVMFIAYDHHNSEFDLPEPSSIMIVAEFSLTSWSLPSFKQYWPVSTNSNCQIY